VQSCSQLIGSSLLELLFFDRLEVTSKEFYSKWLNLPIHHHHHHPSREELLRYEYASETIPPNPPVETNLEKMLLLTETQPSRSPQSHPHSSPRKFLIQSDMGFTTPPANSSVSYPYDLDTVKKRVNFSISQIQNLLSPNRFINTIEYSTEPPPEVVAEYEDHLKDDLSQWLMTEIPRFFFGLHWSGVTTEGANNRERAA